MAPIPPIPPSDHRVCQLCTAYYKHTESRVRQVAQLRRMRCLYNLKPAGPSAPSRWAPGIQPWMLAMLDDREPRGAYCATRFRTLLWWVVTAAWEIFSRQYPLFNWTGRCISTQTRFKSLNASNTKPIVTARCWRRALRCEIRQSLCSSLFGTSSAYVQKKKTWSESE